MDYTVGDALSWSCRMPVLATTRPIVESGDRLTRDEFHRRYRDRPDIRKAELVEGVVYVASPLRSDVHGEPHADVMTWLGTYKARTPGVRVSDNATVRRDAKNDVQPDACLWREEAGGPRLTEDGYIAGAPRLVVEWRPVAPPTTCTTSCGPAADHWMAPRNGPRSAAIWDELTVAGEVRLVRAGH